MLREHDAAFCFDSEQKTHVASGFFTLILPHHSWLLRARFFMKFLKWCQGLPTTFPYEGVLCKAVWDMEAKGQYKNNIKIVSRAVLSTTLHPIIILNHSRNANTLWISNHHVETAKLNTWLTNHNNLINESWRERTLVVLTGWWAYMRQVLLQFLHLFQGRILRLSIFQQTTHVKHIIQVGLDLHRQLVTLRMFTFLTGGEHESALVIWHHT